MNCAQDVLARAYITRHGLVWSRSSNGYFDVYDSDDSGWTFGIVSEQYGTHGSGTSLYDAVLDYQEKSGKGWGS